MNGNVTHFGQHSQAQCKLVVAAVHYPPLMNGYELTAVRGQ